MVAKKSSQSRKSGPTTSKSRAERPQERVPVGGMRDLLTVHGKREDLSYRWVKDSEETGARIFEFLRAGWDFVEASDVQIGQSAVYKTANVGSIVRNPAGDGQYLYLMAIPKHVYDKDQAAKQADINRTEQQILKASPNEGQYGQNSIENKAS